MKKKAAATSLVATATRKGKTFQAKGNMGKDMKRGAKELLKKVKGQKGRAIAVGGITAGAVGTHKAVKEGHASSLEKNLSPHRESAAKRNK